MWEATKHLAAALERSESVAAELLHILGGNGDRARQLAYLLYQKANDRGWAAEAGAYNGLVSAWPNLRTGAATVAAAPTGAAQQTLLQRRPVGGELVVRVDRVGAGNSAVVVDLPRCGRC